MLTRSVVSSRRFRPEIEGLRAVAALLVAVFHVWLGRVSGGVDVFFVVSGFLITTTLFGHFDRFGGIRPFTYLARLGRRLLPASLTVLVAVLVASWFWMPSVLWNTTAEQVRASALYYENWQLAFGSVDYLAQFDEKTPVQHFWAMSAQGQFYVIWLLLFLAIWAAATRARLSRERMTVLAFALFAVVFAVSLAYSVWSTDVRQPFAYFDTVARVWEFALGGLAAIVIPTLRLPAAVRWVIGWVGLVGVVTCGLILTVSTAFPGYVALWPTMCALFVLAAGGSGSRFGADALLATKPMVWLGGFSYGIYLWHWALLIFFLQLTGRESVGLRAGVAVIAGAIALAWLTNVLIERPIRNGTFSRVRNPMTLGVTATLTIAGLIVGGAVGTSVIDTSSTQALERSKQFETTLPEDPCWGARALVADACSLDVNLGEILPDPSTRDQQTNLPCANREDQGLLQICQIGVDGSDVPSGRVLLVGDSHSMNARVIVDEMAKHYGWSGHAISAAGCAPSQAPRSSPAGEEQVQECVEWNRQLVDWINKQDQIDVLFTLASTGRPPVHADGEDPTDVAVQGYLDQWAATDDVVDTVVVLRDWPRLSTQVVICVEQALNASENPAKQCARARDEALRPDPAAIAARSDHGDRYHVIDLTQHFCNNNQCYPVIGRVWTYMDSVHITRTFARSLAPFAIQQFDQLGTPDHSSSAVLAGATPAR